MRSFLLMLAFLSFAKVSAFKGTSPEAGKSYYLFNIYQAKFLSYGNMWGTQASLDNLNPIKVTLESASGGYKINTHCDQSSGDIVVNPSYSNYLISTDWDGKKWPVVNGNYYDNGNVVNRDATVWNISDKDGYYQISCSDGKLAFDETYVTQEEHYAGTALTVTNSLSYAPERASWQLVSESEYAEWTAKKKVTIASLNVDGMPKSVKVAGVYTVNLNPDATEGPGATAIGTRLKDSGFDVVGVSEDFNFHSELWNAAWNGGTGNHYNATTHRGSISAGLGAVGDYLAKNPVLDSDGLCLFYRIDGSANIVTPSNESWVQWNDHYGYDDSGADGLIRKGYRYYLITLTDGTEIDLYTMHMDAESSAGDNAARESQMRQLVAAIRATNNKRPIVIIGDSNCRYTRDKVKELLIDGLNADERFTCRDPWIQFGRNNTYPAYGSSAIMASTEGYLKGEVVDKIWYVNNTESDIRLVAETYAQDLSFVTEEKLPLCDHKPAVVTFSYHDYNPVIDDVAIIETSEEAVYLRNRANGRYLNDGGWWSTHAVVGNYAHMPMYIKSLPNGKYDVSTKFGHITDAAYVDNGNPAEYISEWTILEEDGYKVFAYNLGGTMKALSSNDPTYFNDNPLYRYVTTAPLNVADKNQQWEIVTKSMLDAEIAKASPMNPVNVTHLLPAANFDRNDWDDHGKWTFDNKGNGSRVTDNGIGGIDNDAFCNFNRSVNTKKSTTSSKNQWDCYQSITVPSGYYYITCQGFEKGTRCTYFYAWSNPEGSQVEKTQLLAAYDANDFSAGDSQTAAGQAFNQGKYVNTLPIIKVGNDGKLVVGVKKTENNSTSGWMVFDNFQLIYLGTEAPEDTYYLYNVESGKFLTSGYDFDARGILADEGKAWTPKYLSSGLSLQCEGKGGNLGIATDGLLGLFVDWRNTESWHTEIDANGALTLEQANNRGNYIGWTSESHGDFVCDQSQNMKRELNDAIHWKAIPANQYSSFKTTAAANKTARLAAVDIYRSAIISGIDAAEFADAWHNPNTAASDITAKANALKSSVEAEALSNATSENGYNVSYNIVNATCGDEAHTGWIMTGDWGSQIGVNNSYVNNGIWLAPRFYEKYDGTKLPDAKISQTISGLPAGNYKLALDINAEKQSDTNVAVIGTLLYAKSGTQERVFTECDTHGTGVLVNTFMTPEFTVLEGEDVEIGLSLENTNANWVAFDNWQLIYCGPYHAISLNDADADVATAWNMTGTWRESEMEDVKTALETTPKLWVDATNATLIGKPAIPTLATIPNMMIKANNADDIANTVNVIVGDNCAEFVVTDKYDYAPQQTFTADKVEYIRTNTQGYNTVCMPFVLKCSDFPSTCQVYKFNVVREETVSFLRLKTMRKSQQELLFLCTIVQRRQATKPYG